MAMHNGRFRQLAANPDFISGIYNYCDRWCERCPLTTRCLVYATEREADDDPEGRDITNAKFWSRMEKIFQEAHGMILEWAAETGVDLVTLEAEAGQADREQQRRDATQHELSLSARRYAEMVQRWFEEEFAVEQSVHDDTTGTSKSTEDDLDVSDAIDVIRWYQFFVAAKVFRALMSLDRPAIDEELTSDDICSGAELDDDPALIEAATHDADGSAKIAMIAMDRSASAWRIMQSSMPEKAESIVELLLELGRLRRATEQAFPEAGNFLRPGFDEVISDFVS